MTNKNMQSVLVQQLAMGSMYNTPFYKTDSFKSELAVGALTLLGQFLLKGICYYFDTKRHKTSQANAIELENLKSENRREEEFIRHQHDMELQEKKAQDARELQRQKTEDKIKVDNHRKGRATFAEEDDDGELLPSDNVQDIINEGMTEAEGIEYLSNTCIQQRDIMVAYGPAGIGKTQWFIDVIARITGCNTSLVLSPIKTDKDIPHRALYYDKEMSKAEWKQRTMGRTDLSKCDWIPCREFSINQVLKDIKKRITLNPTINYLIVIDPLTNFGIKQKEIHAFVNSLNTLQEDELAKGRNVEFVLGAHSVKSPKGKGLEDIGGSKFWGEAVKTVLSIQPYGQDGSNLRKIHIDKAKNGKELVRGSEFILSFEKEPFGHNVYDETLNEGWTSKGFTPTESKPSNESNFTNPKWRGVLSQISSEIAERMQMMKDEENKSYEVIAKELLPELELQRSHVQRVIDYVRKVKGLPNPKKAKARA